MEKRKRKRIEKEKKERNNKIKGICNHCCISFLFTFFHLTCYFVDQKENEKEKERRKNKEKKR